MSKPKELTTYKFVDKSGVQICMARIGVSKVTLKNIIDEYKYKYDLKSVNISHFETFLKWLKGQGVAVEIESQVVEWK